MPTAHRPTNHQHATVDPATDTALVAAVAAAWLRGWQPVELARWVGRRDPADRGPLVAAILAEDAARPPGPVHPRWRAQLEELRGEPPGRAAVPAQRAERLAALVAVLPSRQVLIPPPGAPLPPQAGVAFEPDTDDPDRERELTRIRQLLAKAESTGFTEEADAFTAKAQQLMTRYGISRLMVETGVGLPAARRIPVDDPYAWPKAVLLQRVAEANRCRSVYQAGYGDSTVLGFPDQLDAVAVLYTSLLTQATTAMLAAGRHDPANRRRGYRHAFLLAFAGRIGTRLEAAARSATAEEVAARDDSDLLPVLARQDAAVADAVPTVFGAVRSRATSATDPAGWWAGNAAAERVDLGGGNLGAATGGALRA